MSALDKPAAARRRGTWRDRILRAGVARAGLILVPLVLTACGSMVAGSPAAPAGAAGPAAAASTRSTVRRPALCTDQRILTGLTIRRTGAVVRVPQASLSFPPVSVTSAAAARSLAKALCALPRQRAGIVNCPADLGIFYKLRFTAGRQRLPAVTVDASGCMVVHGVGQARTAAGATAVWTALGIALRLPGPIGRQLYPGNLPEARRCGPSTMATQSGKCPGKARTG